MFPYIEFLILTIIFISITTFLGEKFGLLVAKTLFPFLPTKFQVFTKEPNLRSRREIEECIVVTGVFCILLTLFTIIAVIADIEVSSLLFIPFFYQYILIPTSYIPITSFISAVITVIFYAWGYNNKKKYSYIQEHS